MAGIKKTEWEIFAERLFGQTPNPFVRPNGLGSALHDLFGQTPPSPQTPNPFGSPKGLGSALDDLFKMVPPPPPSGGMFGNPFLSSPPATKPFSTPTVAVTPKPKHRSTFYSFHYDDVFR